MIAPTTEPAITASKMLEVHSTEVFGEMRTYSPGPLECNVVVKHCVFALIVDERFDRVTHVEFKMRNSPGVKLTSVASNVINTLLRLVQDPTLNEEPYANVMFVLDPLSVPETQNKEMCGCSQLTLDINMSIKCESTTR